MTDAHEAVREALLDREPGQALDAAHAAHLEGCEDCRAFAAALARVDGELGELPSFEAPPALLERTLDAVARAPREREPARGTLGLFGALLAGVFSGLAALVGLLVAPFRKPSRATWAIAIPAVAAVALVVVGGVGTFGMRAPSSEPAAPAHAVPQFTPEVTGEVQNLPAASDGWRGEGGQEEDRGGRVATDQPASGGLFWADGDDDGIRDSLREQDVDGRFQVALATTPETVNGIDEEGDLAQGSVTRMPAQQQVVDEDQTVNLDMANARGDGAEEGERLGRLEVRRLAQGEPGPTPPTGSSSTTTSTLIPELDEERTEGLPFRAASGYWANTYVPGDPAIRALRLRLADEPAGLRLAELARPSDPSFAPPRTGALALAVEADRAAVEGRSRVTMSVGLRGAAQRAGRRPTLRTQVLLDLRRPLDDEAQGRVRALLDALARRHAGGDAIGLIVAGPDGGARIELGTMRFGELTVALRRAFGPAPQDATDLAMRQALERAVESLGQVEGDGPLGSSMVLVVTPGLTDAEARELEPVAHVGALAGVATSVVGLGPDAALAPMERLALAGQGRRRVLAHARDAEDLAASEITAVSRVVARAVRLRIRLAEGVQLVDVLGSRSLDELEAHRVREAEQAIDRALAARLGIASDRGEDEDGIQIVVPAFYADDTHRVLLDLVVPGPGPVADVQVRYKDLVRLGNATLTDRLVLGRGPAARGPAQRAVHAASLGHHVAEGLRLAAAHLDAGRPDLARASLDATLARLEAATRALPELASEPAVGRDGTLVRRYAEATSAQPADALARSLRYAAHRRLLGDPLGLDGRD